MIVLRDDCLNLSSNHFGWVKPVMCGSGCVFIVSVETRFPFSNQKMFTWEACFSLSCQFCFLCCLTVHSWLWLVCILASAWHPIFCISGGMISCTGRGGYCWYFICYFAFLWNIGTYRLKKNPTNQSTCRIFLTWKAVEFLGFLVIAMTSGVANE